MSQQAIDEAALQEIVDMAIEVAGLLDALLDRSATLPEPQGWTSALTIRPENQVRVLAASCVDQLEFGARALGVRHASIGYGAGRFIGEAFARVKWLMEPADDVARQRRAFQWARADLRAHQRMLRQVTDQELDLVRKEVDKDNQASLAELDLRLTAFAAAMGFTKLNENYPDRKALLDTHSPGHYRYFSMMSTVASHPTNMSMAGTGTGGWYLRAYWTATMVEASVNICWWTATALGRRQWIEQVLDPLVKERLQPLDDRIRDRWHSEADPSFARAYKNLPRRA